MEFWATDWLFSTTVGLFFSIETPLIFLWVAPSQSAAQSMASPPTVQWLMENNVL